MESLLSTLGMIAMNKDIKNMGWEVVVDILMEEFGKTDFLDIGYNAKWIYLFFIYFLKRFVLGDNCFIRLVLLMINI